MTMIKMIHDMIRMGGFEHDTGALPDANELEYLSALLQTGTFLRQDATISSTDIQNYLTSQYGLDISKEDAIDIVCGLGGMALPNENEDDCYLDLVELTTILLIPSLLKAKQEVDLAYGILQPDQPISEDPDTSFQLFRSDPFQYWSNKEIKAKLVKQRKERALHYSLRLMPRRIIRDVLRILSTKVMEDSSYLSPRPIHEKSIPDMFDKKGLLMDLPRMVLTQGFVEELLTACQLDDESKNKPLIHEMIQIAGGEGAVFDELVFAKLLTSDISLYETGVEDNMDSTFQNVYGSKYPRKGASKLNHQEDEAAKSVTVAFHGAVNNAPSADEDDVERPKAEQVSTSASLSERNQPEEYDPKTYSQESKSLSKRRLDSHLPENNELVSFDKFDEIEVGGNTIDCSPPTIKVIGGSEDGYEATLFDSMVSKNSSYTANKISIHSAQENKANQSTTKNPKFIRTAPHIDYASDQYKSIIYHMMIWCYFIFAAALLLGALHLLQFDELDCDSNNFWCVFGKQVWTWFIFGAILSVSGYLVIAPMSLANSPNARLKEIFISLLWVFLFNFLPFIILWDYKAGIPHSDDGDYNETETLMAQEHVELVMILYLFFGVCIFCEILRTLPSIRGSGSRNSWWFLFHLPSSEEREVVMKRAATHKINNFLRHAHELHFGTNGNSRHILERVVLHGCKTENNGGLVWAWKLLGSGRLVDQHGIWLPSNLYIGQEGQVIALIFFFVLGLIATVKTGDYVHNKRTEFLQLPPSPWKASKLYYTPEPWMIYYSFITGFVVAGLVGICLILLYIPSTIATIMQLRSGKIKTLRHHNFEQYRSSPDFLCYNPGNMIYALIGSAVLYWLIFTGAVFLFLWVPSRDFMMLVLGWGLGLGVTILAKMLLTSIPRASYQAAFYRKKPKYANFVMLGLECWNIGLGAGVMLGRLLQFLFAAAFWIGRTDAKFLDEDVQLFGYYFDYIPMNFRKDILVHEAHRHPWIQRIGVMAMMRLRHGPSFGGKAGACWRRIFVAALFPWLLSKYQNSSKKTSQVEDILSSHQGESRDASMVAEDGDDQEWYLKSI